MNIGDNVSVKGWSGIAFYINKLEDDQAEVIMIGDDRKWTYNIDDLKPLASGSFCIECGQVGCYHNINE